MSYLCLIPSICVGADVGVLVSRWFQLFGAKALKFLEEFYCHPNLQPEEQEAAPKDSG